MKVSCTVLTVGNALHTVGKRRTHVTPDECTFKTDVNEPFRVRRTSIKKGRRKPTRRASLSRALSCRLSRQPEKGDDTYQQVPDRNDAVQHSGGNHDNIRFHLRHPFDSAV